MEQIIWTNNDYEEWKECCIKYDGMSEEETTYERYWEERSWDIDDERDNLNVQVDGCIVAFCDLGLWDGRHNGGAVIGSNVKDILSSDCDYIKWYCDRYNVNCTAIHHDGTNNYIYRVAKDKNTAMKLINKIVYDGMTKEQFFKKTKSLRPYVVKVYGFK